MAEVRAVGEEAQHGGFARIRHAIIERQRAALSPQARHPRQVAAIGEGSMVARQQLDLFPPSAPWDPLPSPLPWEPPAARAGANRAEPANVITARVARPAKKVPRACVRTDQWIKRLSCFIPFLVLLVYDCLFSCFLMSNFPQRKQDWAAPPGAVLPPGFNPPDDGKLICSGTAGKRTNLSEKEKEMRFSRQYQEEHHGAKL